MAEGKARAVRRPRFFRSPSEFRRWLAAHHGDTPELLVGFHRKGTGRGGITYHEALDEALCFGWIDGLTRSLDDGRYTIRFTPRRPNSNWSAVNVKRAQQLIELGRMEPPGLAAFERRDRSEAARFSYETRRGLGESEEQVFRRHPEAWAFFEAQPPSYRRTIGWWVVSAKREETRRRRLDALIAHSARGERVP
jgi:uncharacterized protein YdeI (YjbR/CyaY-like superfamily)